MNTNFQPKPLPSSINDKLESAWKRGYFWGCVTMFVVFTIVGVILKLLSL